MRRGWLARALWPVSLLFKLLVKLRRYTYAAGWADATRLPVPVIVVGNSFVGGTGKTPFTIWLAQTLIQAGYRPGIISRGYRAEGNHVRLVTGQSKPLEVGDEPVLIATHTGCPVMVGRKRVVAAQALLHQHPEVNVIVSDDGLQHYALKRDIEIMLFDARGIGNGWLLPAGPLREPATRTADFVVVNALQDNAEASGKLPQLEQGFRMHLAAGYVYSMRDVSRKQALHEITDGGQGSGSADILAAAGIGNPARFFFMLRRAGLSFREMPLPDHYDFTINPFAGVKADIILITEKDAVKCREIDGLKNDPRLWVVPVTAHIDPALAEQILERIRGYSTA